MSFPESFANAISRSHISVSVAVIGRTRLQRVAITQAWTGRDIVLGPISGPGRSTKTVALKKSAVFACTGKACPEDGLRPTSGHVRQNDTRLLPAGNQSSVSGFCVVVPMDATLLIRVQ